MYVRRGGCEGGRILKCRKLDFYRERRKKNLPIFRFPRFVCKKFSSFCNTFRSFNEVRTPDLIRWLNANDDDPSLVKVVCLLALHSFNTVR